MNKITGYSYIPQVYQNPLANQFVQIYLPMIPIKVANNHHEISPQFDALLDSGSDLNLLPMSLAKYLGINFGKTKSDIVYGIGKSHIKAFSGKITIWLGDKSYKTEANFSVQQKIPILGRDGFFNLFRSIKFDEKGQFVYIEEF